MDSPFFFFLLIWIIVVGSLALNSSLNKVGTQFENIEKDIKEIKELLIKSENL